MQIYKTLTRVFIDPEKMDRSVAFYEKLFGLECELRFTYAEKGLELAMVGSVLLIAGSEDCLRPFTDTRVTYLVDSVDDFTGFFEAEGGTVLAYPKPVPTGKNMRVRHPDGLVAEYVEHHNRNPVQ